MRKSALLPVALLALATIFPFTLQPSKADTTSGLVAHWRFDDQMDPTEDSAGTNDGGLINAPTFSNDAAPIFNNVKALDFNGINQYVKVEPVDPPLDDIGTAFTVSVWAKLDALQNPGGFPHHLISRDECCPSGSVAANRSWTLTHFPDGRAFFQVIGDDGLGTNGLRSAVGNAATPVPVGKYFNLVGVFDSSSSRIDVYRDGVNVTNSIDVVGPFPTKPHINAVPITIGAHAFEQFQPVPGVGNFVDGLIDDVRIYNRALSDAEVAALFASRVDVSVDIKPGSDQNTINLSGAGVVPVAILSTQDFDAPLQVDPDTISLAGASVRMIGKGDKYSCNERDVNDDTFPDLVCKVETAEFMLVTGDSEATLEAHTFDSFPVRGTDFIRIVPDN